MNAPDKYNLSHHFREHLSEEIIAFTRLAGETAQKRGMRLYLVGDDRHRARVRIGEKLRRDAGGAHHARVRRA